VVVARVGLMEKSEDMLMWVPASEATTHVARAGADDQTAGLSLALCDTVGPFRHNGQSVDSLTPLVLSVGRMRETVEQVQLVTVRQACGESEGSGEREMVRVSSAAARTTDPAVMKSSSHGIIVREY
jgi:hypothetical protein